MSRVLTLWLLLGMTPEPGPDAPPPPPEVTEPQAVPVCFACSVLLPAFAVLVYMFGRMGRNDMAPPPEPPDTPAPLL